MCAKRKKQTIYCVFIVSKNVNLMIKITYLFTAMVNAGISEQRVNIIFAELNLPRMHHKTLKGKKAI